MGQMEARKAGVYLIRCLADSKVYVGKSDFVQRRWRQHQYHLNRGRHPNVHLQRAWNLYGREAFSFVLLQEEPDSQARAQLELQYIQELGALHPGQGFNTQDPSQYSPTASEPPLPHVKLPPLSRAKIYTKRGSSDPKVKESTRRKMSLARRGRPKTEETRFRMSLANAKRKEEASFSWPQVHAMRKLSLESPYNRYGGISQLARHLNLSYPQVYKIVRGHTWGECERAVPRDIPFGITVYTGPMFAGKSRALIAKLKEHKKSGQRVLCVKPLLDTRRGVDLITSHDGRRIEATPVQTAQEILDLVAKQDAQVVGLDEVQFFGPDLLTVCKKLVAQKIRVFASGLNLDFRGQPFGVMPQLLALADDIIIFAAICTICGGYATRTQRLGAGTELVELGAKEEYDARCYTHFTSPDGDD